VCRICLDAMQMEFPKPQHCAASIIVAASVFTLLCFLSSDFTPVQYSATLVTLCIIQAFSLVNHIVGPQTKVASQSLSSRFATAASSSVHNILSNTNNQVAAVGLLAGLLAMFIRVAGLCRPVVIPVASFVLGGLFCKGMKLLALMGMDVPQDDGVSPQGSTLSHHSKAFWPELRTDVEEDLRSESILADVAGEPALSLPCPWEVDELILSAEE